MKIFMDSDILIWHLRGKEEAKNLFAQLVETYDTDLWIGAMQRAEIVFFMRKSEETATMGFLSLFNTHPVDQAIIDLAGKYYRKWHPSYGIDPNDAILAATFAFKRGFIFRLNVAACLIPDFFGYRGWICNYLTSLNHSSQDDHDMSKIY